MRSLILIALLQFTPLTDHRPGVYLEGNWQSCIEEDGYSEKIYSHFVNGKEMWNLHLGPKNEFALFKGPMAPEEEHVGHDDPSNLLTAFRYDDVPTTFGGRNWTALGLHINVVRAGGSRDECESYFILVELEKVNVEKAQRPRGHAALAKTRNRR